MNQRSYPRTEFKTAAALRCPTRNISYGGVTHDIGTGGLCISGLSRMHEPDELSVVLPLRGREVQIPCRVAWTDKMMIGVQFVDMTPSHNVILKDLIDPSWDGDNLLEGLMLLSQYLAADSLSDWLRITSMLEKHFRRSLKFSHQAIGMPTTSSGLH